MLSEKKFPDKDKKVPLNPKIERDWIPKRKIGEIVLRLAKLESSIGRCLVLDLVSQNSNIYIKHTILKYN